MMPTAKRARMNPVKRELLFHEAMGLVEYHHAGHLNSYEADAEVIAAAEAEVMLGKLLQAHKICSVTNHGEEDDDRPTEAEAIIKIREIVPDLIADLVDYDSIFITVTQAYNDALAASDAAVVVAANRAWQAITDARELAMEPLARASRLVSIGGDAATVVRELRELVPDLIANDVDPQWIFQKVDTAHRMALFNCRNHPRQHLLRRMVEDYGVVEYEMSGESEHSDDNDGED